MYLSLRVGGGSCGLTCIDVCVCMCANVCISVTVAETVATDCEVTVQPWQQSGRLCLIWSGRTRAAAALDGFYLFEQSTRWRRGGWMKQGISSPPPPPLPPPARLSSLSHSLRMFQSSPVAAFHTNISITASGTPRSFVRTETKISTSNVV